MGIAVLKTKCFTSMELDTTEALLMELLGGDKNLYKKVNSLVIA